MNNNNNNNNNGEGKTMGYLCRIAAVFLIAFIIAAIILGYFVNSIDKDGEVRDGFGRLLDEVPGAMSIILPQWAGFIWFFIDCLILLALVIAIDRLFVKSKTYFTGEKNVDF